jgi:Nif-specific regulatory protein
MVHPIHMNPANVDPDDVARLERERDLYLRLLNLGLRDEPESFLEEALELVTRVIGAHQGYLEIDPHAGASDAPRWWAAHGFSEAEIHAVRQVISRGIIAQAIATGETIVTASALGDERFESRMSVRGARIEAVLCAPIGSSGTPLGVIYLQRRIEPGPFSEEDRRKADVFARHVAPYADRLLARSSLAPQQDPTQPYRERLRLDSFIGRSAAVAAVLREVALVAPLDIDVLLTGGSGTGKSQMARIIHENSLRAAQPFVELNCAAMPESLIESELFGAVQGAHSTAVRRIDGKLAAAQGGTLLLDEVAELSPSAQAKLLQLLQSRVYYPLGSTRAVRADLRIIAATNIELGAAVADGKFREDLLYRLNVLPIRMPSLAERREDIADLARYFCATACERHRLPRVTISEHLAEALAAAEWPGNIRQLSHAIEAAAIRAAGAGILRIERAHVFPPTAGPGRVAADVSAPAAEAGARATFQEATRRFQAQLIRETLEETGWNIVEASRRLEVARSHLYALIRAFGIERAKR